jgi:hypothetical protein
MTPPTRPYDPYPHRRGEPRQFVLWWTGYLLAASMISYGSGSTSFGFLGYEVTRPAATILLAMLGLGIGVLWPMVRLSQTPPHAPHPPGEFLSARHAQIHAPTQPAPAFFTDCVVVTLPALVVLTAQCMPWMSGWSAPVALALAVVLVSWSVLTASLLTLYFRVLMLHLPRWAWMLVHILACTAAPLFALILISQGWNPAPRLETTQSTVIQTLLTFSPVTAPFEIARDRSWLGAAASVAPHHIVSALAPLAVAMLTLIVTGVRRRIT